ncbi:MAG TPA: tetratricopeptide repeat protein [Thermodesulfovibrionales bacterium]|nr:tetratricopeptide repeat protein [Thermodesulfovibrionales bacterium]
MGKSSRKKRRASGEITAGKDTLALSESHHENEPLYLGGRTRKLTWLIAVAVALLTFAAYLPSLQNGFVSWDDEGYVLHNPQIRSLNAAFLRWAFSSFYASNWHPLTWISHALDYAVWGLNPLGHHLTNNILHAINAFLVVLLVVRLLTGYQACKLASPQAPGKSGTLPNDFRKRPDFPSPHDSRFVLIAAATTGLLFGVHPIHVESVAWVAERKDLLCAFFFLLSTITYTYYLSEVNANASIFSTPRFFNRRYLLTTGFFILSLLSKPMAVSLPVVLLILDWYPFKRIRSVESFWSSVIEKVPFIALSLISSVLTLFAQKTAMQLMEFVPLPTRMLVAANSLIGYLWNMVLPVNLIPYYPYPKDISLFSLGYFFSIVLAVVISAASVILMRKQKLWLAVWAYYVITMIPVLGIVQVGSQAMADRYTYLPGLGPFLVMGLAVAWASARIQTVKTRSPALTRIAVAAAVFLCVPMAYLTVKQIHVWKSSITLWDSVIERTPMGVSIAYTNRGLALMKMGRLDGALEDFNKAIALDPSDYKAYGDRGLVFDQIGQSDKAIEDFDKAIALNPAFYEAYTVRGALFDKMGQIDKAISDFDKAIALNPRFGEAYYNRGVAYGKAGRYKDSLESLSRSIEIDPYKADVYVSRGVSYALIGQYDRALEDLSRAIELDQRYTDAYANRANLYLKTGNKAGAVSDFQKACDLGDNKACQALRDL